MWLLLLFILIPLLEIWLFILLGGFIGVYPTLLIILLTAILSTFLVKTQGINVLKEIQSKFNELENPTEPIAHGAMILFAGALLLCTAGYGTVYILGQVFPSLVEKLVFLPTLSSQDPWLLFLGGLISPVYQGIVVTTAARLVNNFISSI